MLGEKAPAADPSKVDADFALQGEYAGDVINHEGKNKWGAQVLALGDHKFRLMAYFGGLPAFSIARAPRRIFSSA